jgi:hypothetical protein
LNRLIIIEGLSSSHFGLIIIALEEMETISYLDVVRERGLRDLESQGSHDAYE